MANGALGALAAWLENKKRVAGRQLRDLVESPNDFGRMQAARFKQDQAEYMSDPASGLDFIAGPLGGLAGVVKAKGGNWMPGSVEKALSSLKEHMGETRPEVLAQIRERMGNPELGRDGEVMGRWIEGPLQKYVKTQMATPEDPVRALAEQGILHYAPEMQGNTTAMRNRMIAGTPQMGTARSRLARDWEDATDNMVRARQLGAAWRPGSGLTTRSVVEAEGGEWASRLPDETMIHDLLQDRVSTRELPGKLGFDHLTDELRNALNPESGLPRNLLLRPEQMQQMGMEKAVRHVAAINDWRAAQKAAANQELASKAMAVREYAENNPKGLRWVELGKDTPELEKQLRYEGDTMGHCVGGYCDDVVSGRSRIFSLRDAKGEPHVTVEVAKNTDIVNMEDLDDWLDTLSPSLLEDWKKVYAASNPTLKSEVISLANEFLDERGLLDAQRIVQIKGKQNKAPNPEYLPFVQDFVKNSPIGGKWGTVGDLQNAGLIEFMGRYVSPDDFSNIAKRHFGETGNRPDEIESAYDYYRRIKRYDPSQLSDTDTSFIKDVEAGNFANGGLVHSNPFGDVTPHAMLNRVIDAYNQL